MGTLEYCWVTGTVPSRRNGPTNRVDLAQSQLRTPLGRQPDLLVANYFCGSSYKCSHGSVGELLGNGDGTFQETVTYGSGGYGAFVLAIADLNGDE